MSMGSLCHPGPRLEAYSNVERKSRAPLNFSRRWDSHGSVVACTECEMSRSQIVILAGKGRLGLEDLSTSPVSSLLAV